MKKVLPLTLITGITALSGCTQGIQPTDMDRAIIGAAAGATVQSVRGKDTRSIVKGAAIGGAAGSLCNDVRLCQ